MILMEYCLCKTRITDSQPRGVDCKSTPAALNSMRAYLEERVLDIQEYLLTVRTKLAREKEGQLFLSMEGKPELKNNLLHLFRPLKKIEPGISNANQIRQSVITNWLKSHNLRQVQYMAGHKYVSSTERYQQNNIEDLQKEVSKYHPLNGNQI